MKDKPVTIRELAQELGISVSSVSRALHDHPSISLDTRKRVQQLAKERNYEPNHAAIMFQQGRSDTIGVILPDLGEAFFSSAISAIESVADTKGYNVLFAQSYDNKHKELELINKLRKHRIDGLIISVTKETEDYAYVEMLEKAKIPVVFFDRAPKEDCYNKVTCNLDEATQELVELLLKRGHRNIGLINGPANLSSSEQRKAGYYAAMEKHRLKITPQLILNTKLTKDDTEMAVDKLLALPRKPTAIIMFNDYSCLHAMQHARKLGANIEFGSFANLPYISYLNDKPTASIEQFPEVQGKRAADLLFDLLKEKQKSNVSFNHNIIVDAKLVIHKTE